MQNDLSELEINGACRIIDRGLYFYDKLSDHNVYGYLKNHNEIPEFCFFVRSLAEICEGMWVWFDSIENIKTFNNNASPDFLDIVCTQIDHIQRYNLNPKRYPEAEMLRVKSEIKGLKNKYNLGDQKKYIKGFREREFMFPDTMKVTSKIIHQDEYSIGDIYLFTIPEAVEELAEAGSDIPSRLKDLTNF